MSTINTTQEFEPLASITTDPRFIELAAALAKTGNADEYGAALQLLASHIDGQLGRQYQSIQNLMRLNTQLAEMAASAPPAYGRMVIDWSTDYLTEQRAAMRDAAAQLAEGYGPSRPIAAARPSDIIQGRWEGEQAASSNIAAAIRQLEARPVLTQGSIDRAKDALEDFAGAVWDKPNSASQVDPVMALPHRTHAQHLEYGASSVITPERKAEQARGNATHRAQLDAMAGVFLPPPQAKHTPILEAPRGYDYIQAACSCGWKGIKRDPLTRTGEYDAARDETARHIREMEQERRE